MRLPELPSEGKVEHIPALLVTEELITRELNRLFDEVEEYPVRDVLGIMDLSTAKVNVPTTVYQISGDDTSGIAGLLYPNGEFLAVNPPRKSARFWEYDETLRYEKQDVPADAPPEVRRAKANSWTSGEVLWDGSVGNSIDPVAEDGDRNGPVNKRTFDGALTPEWPENNGELWKAIGRGTAMQ